MVLLCVVCSIFSFLWVIRMSFTLFFFVPAMVCLANETSTETCGNKVLTQDVKDKVNMAGTFVEDGSSFLAILLLFCWDKFNVINLLLIAPRLPVFWFWIGLFCIGTLSTINMDFDSKKWDWLGASLILENATLIVLSLALKFIDKSTVKTWIERRVSNQHCVKFIYYLYILTLWMYLLRNLSLLFYDMAVFAKKIDRHAGSKQIDNIMKIGDIAIRGSFVQFYYATIFRNPNLSTVCKEHSRTPDNIFPIDARVSAEQRQALVAWEPYIS